MTANGPESESKAFKKEIRGGVAGSPYPAAVESNGFTFVAAIGGVDESGKVVSLIPVEQAARAIENLKAVLAANGQGSEHVVKCTIYVTDLRHTFMAERALKAEFQNGLPACSWIEVKGLPEGQEISIEAIAVRPSEGKDVYDFMG